MCLEDIKITTVLDKMRGLSVFLELLSFFNTYLNRRDQEPLGNVCEKYWVINPKLNRLRTQIIKMAKHFKPLNFILFKIFLANLLFCPKVQKQNKENTDAKGFK